MAYTGVRVRQHRAFPAWLHGPVHRGRSSGLGPVVRQGDGSPAR